MGCPREAKEPGGEGVGRSSGRAREIKELRRDDDKKGAQEIGSQRGRYIKKVSPGSLPPVLYLNSSRLLSSVRTA
jgi:hypothetical protein